MSLLVQSNYTYLHNFNVWPIYATQKARDVHNVKYLIAQFDVHHNFLKKKNHLLCPYRSQMCVKGQNICMHGVLCLILINLIMQHDYFE